MSKIKKGQFQYFTSFPSKIFGTFLIRLRKSPEQPLNWETLPKLLSLRETAKVLNVHPNTLRLWDQRGTLRAVRIGVRHDRRYKREMVRAQWLLTQSSPSERITKRWVARQELIHRLQRVGLRPWSVVASLVIVAVMAMHLGQARADQSNLVTTNLQPQECTGWVNAQQAQSINASAQGESFIFSKDNSAQYSSDAFQVHSTTEGIVSGSVDTPNDTITCHGFSVRRIPTGANVTGAQLILSFQARSAASSSSSFSLETSLDGASWTTLKVLPATADVQSRMVVDLPSMDRDQLAKLRVRIVPDVEINSPAVTALLDGVELQTTATAAAEVAPAGTPKAKQTLDRLVAFSKSVYSAEETPIMTVPKKKVTKVLFVPTKRVDWKVNRVTLVDQNGNETEATYTARDIAQGDSVNTTLALQTANIHPGRYRLNVTMTSSDGGAATSSKDFLWGVVAVNFDRATPRPGESVQVAIAVLDDAGRTICDANVEAKLTDPHGKTSTYNTDRKSIVRNSNCIDKGVTNSPDYQLHFTPADAGTYHFTLKAKTAVGDRTYEENILVGTSEKFDVQRSAEPTRIYPPAPYTVTIGVTPLQDYVGVVTERVPANFLITTLLPEGSIIVAASPTDHQLLEWSVDWKKGQTYLLHYTFDAPDISPALFTTGPLTIASNTLSGYDYLEPRAWQIASDTLIKKTKENIKFKALDDVTGDWDATQSTLISTARPIYTADEQVAVKLWTKGFSLTSDPSNPATIKNIEVTSSGGPSAGFDEADDLVKKNGRERTIVYLVPNEHFRPGIYSVNYVVSDRNGDRAVSFPIQWGTVDTIIASGKHFAGDQLDLQLVSVDVNGNTDCVSSLELTVTAPDGKQTTSSTIDGKIDAPISCQQQAAQPEGNYVLRTIPELAGTYHLKLTRTAGDQVFFTERNITLTGRDATPENVRQDIEGAVHGPKKLYRPSEKPTIEVDTQTSGLLGLNKKTREITAVKLIDPSTKVEVVDPTMTEVTDGGKTTSSFTFDPTVMHRPGKYTVVMTVVQDGFSQQITQDFTWGVLDVNVRRSYSHSNTAIEVGMSVLDDGGHTQCSADVQLDVTDPAGKVQHFTTADNTILIDPDCVDRGVTIKPDYSAQYTTGGPGQYTTTVTATIANGTRTITDTFQVDDTVPFDVERTTFPTRIYPHPTYPVSFTITAREDFAGAVTETVTSMFDITDISDAGVQTTPDPATKVLTWSVDWKAGETHTLGYTIAFPDRAPDFYVIGPLQIGTFKEARQWQIASDASSCTLSYSAAANWTTAAWATCNSSYPGATVSGDTASITNVTTGATLTLNTSITTNALASLTINANAVASTLALGANTLTVNGTVTVTQPSAAVTTTLSMTSGSLVIQNSNNLAMAGTTTTASTIATVTVTTGLLDVGGSITYTATASMPAANKVVSLNNNGTIRVRSAETLNCGTLRNATTAGTLQFDGLLTIGSATCASASTFSTIAASTVKLGGGLTTVASSTPTVTFNATSIANFTGTGSITPSAGTLTLGKVLIDSGDVVTLAGNVTVAGTGAAAFTNNNTTGSWTGAFTTTFSGATPTIVGDTTFSTLTTTGAATNFTVGANTTVTVTNNYSDAQGAGATKLDLDTNSGAALSIGGTMTIRNSSGASTNTYKVGQGTLTVTGEIIWTGTSATTSRIGSLTLTSGTINANGGIDTTGTPATCNGCNNINISGGAGHFYLQGHVQANNVNEGASGWVFTNTTCTSGGGEFVYQDTAAQTVYFPSSGGYCNLTSLNTNASGATLNGNITTTNLKGNLTVGKSDGSVAAILNLNNKTIAGNGGATMFVYDTATVVQIGATGGSFPSGFGTFTLTSNSNYNFLTSGTTTAIGAITYGNVNFIPSTTVTFTFPAGTVTVGGTMTIGNGTNTTVVRDQINGTTLNVAGNFTMANNSQFTADTTNAVTVGGNFAIGATSTTFTHNNGTFVFNGTTGTDTIDTDAQPFYNVIFNGSGGTWKPVTNNITIANDLTMTAGTLQGNGALNVTVNGNIVCGASCGTIDMTANTGSGTFTQNVAAAEGFGTSVTADTTAWSFVNLTFSSSAGTNTITTSTTPTAPGNITVTGLLSIGANTTLSNGDTARTWILSANTGTSFTLTGTLSGTGRLTYQNSATTFPTGGTLGATPTIRFDTLNGNMVIPARADYGGIEAYGGSANARTVTLGTAGSQTITTSGNFYVMADAASPNHVTLQGATWDPTLNVGGDFDFTGTGGANEIVTAPDAAATWTMSGNVNLTNGAWTTSAETLIMNGASDTLTTASNGLNNVTFSGSGTTTLADNLSVAGNLTLNNTISAGSTTISMTGSGKTLVGGSATISGLTISDNSTLDTTGLSMSGTLTVAASKTLTINTITLTDNGGEVSWGNGSSTIDGTGKITFTNASGGPGTNGILSVRAVFDSSSGNIANTTFDARTYGGGTTLYANSGTAKTISTVGSGTYVFSSTLTITSAGAGATTLDMNTTDPTAFTVTGTFTNDTTSVVQANSSGAFNINGNYVNNGTFTHNSGTVTAAGSAQQDWSGTLAGGTGKFNNLVVTNAFGDGSSTFSLTFAGDAETAATFTATTANTKLRFNATSTYTFQNFTVNGQATGTRVYLRSSTGASAWLLNVAGTATVSYTNVMDSNATGSAAPIDASNGTSFNATGNTNWNFVATISVSGTIYQSGAEGSVFDCSGANNITLHVSTNGGTNVNGTCSAAGGTFTVTGVTAPSGADIPVAIFSDSASANKLTTVTLSSGTGNISGLTLIIGRVVVSQESATAITNTHLNTADNTDAGIRYAVSSGNLTVESGMELHVLTGKTFTPGGTVTTTAASTAGNPDGDVHITASATLNMAGNALSVGGDLTNAGTLTVTGSQTTTMTATGSGFTLTSGGATLRSLTFNGASGGWTNSGALTVDEVWTGTAGGFTQANSTTIRVNGTSFSLANGFTWTKASSGANLILENATNLAFADNNSTKQNLGVVQIGASPGTTTLTTDMSADSVTIPTGDTFNTKGYDVTSTGSLDCQGTCVLNLSDSGGSNEGDGTVMTIGGDWTTSATSTFTADTSTVIMNGTGTKSITQGGGAFNILQTNNTGTYNVGGSITDDFERGSLGGNWTGRQGTPVISGSSDFGGSAAGDNTAAYTGATFGGDQFAEGTISALSAGNETQICVRVSASGPLAYYCLTSDGTLLDINEFFNGSWAGTVASGTVYAAVGDRLRLEAVGSTLRAYINGRLYITATDASTATGYPGLNVWAGGTPTSTVEDFTAGNILHTAGDITNSQGTLATGVNSVQVDGGDITVSGTYSQSSNGVTTAVSTGSIGGSGTTTFGGLIVGNTGTTQTTTAGGDFSANNIVVPQSSGTNTLAATTRTITITSSGAYTKRPFIVYSSELFDKGTSSTVKFTGTANTDIADETFYNLTVAPSGAGSPTFTWGDGSVGEEVMGLLTVGDGSNTVLLDTGVDTGQVLNDVTVNAAASLAPNHINGSSMAGSLIMNGSFYTDSADFGFISTTSGHTISGSTLTTTGALSGVGFSGSGGAWTINNDALMQMNVVGGATVVQGANVNLTIDGIWNIASGATFTKASGSGTVTFIGTTATTFTDANATKQNVGKVTIMKTHGTPSNNKVTLASGMLVDTLTISASNTLDLANSGYIIEVANAGSTATPLVVTGTLTPNSSSTVKFSATNSGGNINIPTNSYASLDLSPGSAETYDVAGDFTVSDTLTVGTNATMAVASTKTVTLSKNTGTSLTLNGTVNGAGRLSYQNSATTFPTSGTISSIARIDTLNGNMAVPARTFGGDLEIQNTSGVGRTVNLGTGAAQTITIGGSFTWATSGGAGSTLVVDGSVTNTTNPIMAITGSVVVSGSPTGAITMTMGTGGWAVGGSFDLTNVTTLNAGNILTMNGTGTLTTNGKTLVGFTTTGSGTITLASATHTFSGPIVLGSSATIVPGTSTVVMNTGGTTIQGGGQSLYAFTVNPASATVTLGTTSLTVTNQLTVASTTTLAINSGVSLTNTFSTNASISGTISGAGTLRFTDTSGGPGTTGTLSAKVRFDATAGDIASTTVDARSYRGGVELYSSSGSNRVITYPTGTFTCTGSSLGLYLYADGAGNLTVDQSTNNPSTINTCGAIDFLGTGGGTEILNQGTGNLSTTSGDVNFTGGTYTSNGTLTLAGLATQTLTTAGNTLKNLTVSTADFIFANETVTVSGNLNLSGIGGSLTPGTSTIVMTGTSNTINNAGWGLYNLTIDPASAGTITDSTGFYVTHNLTVASGDTLSLGAGSVVTIGDVAATLTLTGTISGTGAFWYQSAVAFPTTGTITTAVWFVSDLGTDIIASARTYGGDVNIDHGSASNFKTVFGTAGSQTLDITGNLILGVDGTGNNTIDAATWDPAVNVTGSVLKRTDTGSGIRTIQSGSSTWTVGGDVNLTGITYTAESGNTLKMTGATKTLTSASNSLHHFEIAGGSTTMADTATLAGNMTITSGTLTAPATLNVQGNWSNAGGTFTEGTGTVNLTGAASMTLNSGCANTDTCTNENFYNLTLNKTDAADANDNVTLTTNGIRVTNTITVTDGELIQGALNVRVEGATAVSIASGSDKKWTNISTGDLKLGGTFTSAGTVVFNSNNGTQCVDAADDIVITSTVGGTQRLWTNTGTMSIYNVNATDMTNSSITAYTSTLSNTTWTVGSCGITVSGIIRQSSNETTAYDCSANTLTIGVTVNGGTSATSDCTLNTGAYSITTATSPSAAGDPVVVYINNGETPIGTTVTLSVDTSSNITNLDIIDGRVVLTHENAGPMTNAKMATGDNGNAGIRYSVATGNLTTESGIELHVKASKTFTAGGTVSTNATGGDFHVLGTATLGNASNSIGRDISVATGATLNINADTTVEGGDIITAGTGIIAKSGVPTVLVHGTGTIGGGSGAVSFYNLTIGDGTTATSTQDSNVTVSHTLVIGASSQLSINSGKVATLSSLTGTSFTLNGTVSGAGTVSYSNTATVFPTTGTVNSRVQFNTSIIDITIPARTYGSDVDCYDLAGGTCALGAGTINISGSLATIDNGDGNILTGASTNPTVNLTGNFTAANSGTGVTIFMGSGTWTIGGSVDLSQVTAFNNNSGSVIMNGTSKTLTSAGKTFNNLTLSGSITLDDASGDHYVAGDLTLSGTIAPQSSVVRMTGITKNLTGGGNSLSTLYIDPSSTGTITLTGSDLSINSALTVASGDTLSLAASRNMTLGVGATVATTGTISGSGKLIYQNTSAAFPAALTISSALRMDATNGAQTIGGTNSATRTFGGAVEIYSDNNLIGRTVTLENGTARTFAFGGGLTITANNSQAVTLTADTATDPTVTVTGNLAFTSAGTAETLVSGSGTWSVSGNVDFSGGTYTATSGNTLTMTGTGTLTTNGNSLYNFATSGAGTVTFANATHTITGDMTLVSGKTITPGTSTISMTGSGKNLSGGGKDLYSLTIGANAVTVTENVGVSNTLTVATSNVMTITAAKYVILYGSSTVSLTGTINGTGTLLYLSSAAFPSGGTISSDLQYSPVGGTVTITSRTYDGNVSCLDDGSIGVTCYLTGTPVFNGNLTVDDAGVGVTLDATTNNPNPVTIAKNFTTSYNGGGVSMSMGTGTWNVSGNFDLSNVASFSQGTGVNAKLVMDGNNGTGTLTDGAFTLNHLSLIPASGKTVVVGSGIDVLVGGDLVLGGLGTLTTTGSRVVMSGTGFTITGGGKTLNNLTISGNTTLQTSDLIVAGALVMSASKTLTITGVTLTNSGTTDISWGASSVITGTGLLTFTSASTGGPATGGTLSVKVRFDASGGSIPLAVFDARTYGGDLDLYSNATGAKTITFATTTYNITGNLTVIAGASQTVSFGATASASNPTVNLTGNLAYSKLGSITPSITSGTGVWTVSGNANFTSGIYTATSLNEFKMDGASKTLTNGTFYKFTSNGSIIETGGTQVANVLTVNSGKSLTINGNTTSTTAGTISMTGGTIDGSGSLSYLNSTGFPTAGTLNVAQVYFIPVAGSVTIPGRTYGGSVDCQDNSISGSTCSLSGTIAITGTLSATDLGISATLNGSPTSVTIGGNFMANTNGGTRTFDMNGTWSVSGDFDIASFSTFNANASSLTMDGAAGSVTLSSAAYELHDLTLQPASGKTITVSNGGSYLRVNNNLVLGGVGSLVTTGETILMINGTTATFDGGNKTIYGLAINKDTTLQTNGVTVSNLLTINGAILTITGVSLTNTYGTDVNWSGGTITGTGTLIFPNGAGGPGTAGTLSAKVRYDATNGDVASSTVDARTYGGIVEPYNNSATNRTITMAAGTYTLSGSSASLNPNAAAGGNLALDASANNPTVTMGGDLDFTGTGDGTELLSAGTGTWTVSGNVDFTNGVYGPKVSALTAAYSETANRVRDITDICGISTSYTCGGGGTYEYTDTSDCVGSAVAGTETIGRAANMFDLSSLTGATILTTQLGVSIGSATGTEASIGKGTTDAVNTLACVSNAMWNTLGQSTYGTTSGWTSTGGKLHNLGATGVADVQSRAGSATKLTVSIRIGTLDAAQAVYTTPANLFVGYYTSGSPTLVMNGSSKTLTTAGNTLYNASLSGSITLANETQTIANNLNMTSGTITPGTSTVNMTGTAGTLTGPTSGSLNNLTIDPVSAGTITQAGDLTVGGLLTTATGDTYSIPTTKTVTLTGTSGTTLTNNGTVSGSGRLTYMSSTAFPTTGTISSILRFDATGAASQTISSRTYGGAVEIYNNSGGAKTVASNAGTMAFSGALDLSVGSGTVTLDLNTTDPTTTTVSGNVTIGSGATLSAPSTNAFNANANYTNNGTFTDNSGTVTLAGSSQQTLSGTMTGSSDFNNLTITNVSGSDPDSSPSVILGSSLTTAGTFTAATANTKLRFNAASTYTLNAINFSGTAGNLVTLRSSTPGTATTLNAGAGARTVTYTSIQDNNACGSTGGEIDASDGTNVDKGNASCWLIGKLTVILSGTTVNLTGVNPLTTGFVNFQGVTSTVTTNAPNGYVSTVNYGGAMTNGTDTIADAGGSATAGTSGFGASTSKASQTLAQTNTSPSCSTTQQQGAGPYNATTLTTSGAQFAAAAGSATNDATTLCFLGAISGSQAPGQYSSTVTLVTTARF